MDFQDNAHKRAFDAIYPASTTPTTGGKKKKVQSFRLKKLRATDSTHTNDEVHSSIPFCPVMKQMIDTPQFQRLHMLKQLGTAEYVYTNANHNRFEHSLGVAYLARSMCEQFRAHKNLRVTEKDVLCVELAGLCHDLGHGPFSHIYDGDFRKKIAKKRENDPSFDSTYEVAFGKLPLPSENWCHEVASLMMIDALLEHLGLEIDMDNLDRPLKQIGDGVDADSMRVFCKGEPEEESKGNTQSVDSVLTSRDFVFIKECIIGEPLKTFKIAEIADNHSGFIGRQLRSQEFLYDIVSNRHNGLDVDKLDYYARDQRRTKRDAGEILNRVIEEAKVARAICPRPAECFRCKHSTKPGMHLMTCYPEKMIPNAIKFFNLRFELHTDIYHHKTSVAVTLMICDILMLADAYFKIPTFLEDDDNGHKGNGVPFRFLPISRAMLHKTSYLRLCDDVIGQIEATTKSELKEARKLIRRIRCRDFYKCAARRNIIVDNKMDEELWEKKEEEIIDDLIRLSGEHPGQDGQTITLEAHDIIVDKDKRNHGCKDKNPVSFMRFLPKTSLSKLTKPLDQLPEAVAPSLCEYKAQTAMEFEHKCLRLYCRDSAQKVELLAHVYELWVQEYETQLETPVIMECYAIDNYEFCDAPVTLTQESFPRTPQSYSDSDEDISPVPFARMDTNCTPTRSSAKRSLVLSIDTPKK